MQTELVAKHADKHDVLHNLVKLLTAGSVITDRFGGFPPISCFLTSQVTVQKC